MLTWLNRLESDDMAKHDAIVYGQQVILAREGAGVCGTEFGRTLGKGLYEFRLRHTRDERSSPDPATSCRSTPATSSGPTQDRAVDKPDRRPAGQAHTQGAERPISGSKSAFR